MTTTILIAVCLLLLLAYVFDVSASKTKIPSVLLLLFLGWLAQQLALSLSVNIPQLDAILPLLGTIGLILIVLEGALDLSLDKSKLPMLFKAMFMALMPMLLFSFLLAFVFVSYSPQVSFVNALVNAIPLAVISSAIAIPSAKHLTSSDRSFVTYESSLSDIFGVLMFNYVALNTSFNAGTVVDFGLDLCIILILSFVAIIGLAYLLARIKHQVKFAPIILLIILFYAISKLYHLPGLVFILLFGLFLSNLSTINKLSFVKHLDLSSLSEEVHKFHQLTGEMAFLIRALFFLLFGFLMNQEELLNQSTLVWSLSITAAIFIIRAIVLKVFKLPFSLLFFAPRGLITILLFLSIPASQLIDLNSKSLVIQLIVFSCAAMVLGGLGKKKHAPIVV